MAGDESKKEHKDSKDDYEERIKKLEKKIEELETEKETIEVEEPSIVGDVVGQFIPGLCGLIKNLEKTSPEFKQRIADTDSEIKHRIEMGWESKPQVEYGFTMRPLGAGAGRPGRRKGPTKPRAVTVKIPEKVPTKEPIIDVFEVGNFITVIAELPGVEEKEIETKLVDNELLISVGDLSKTIELPSPGKEIVERTCKHGVLQLKIEKVS